MNMRSILPGRGLTAGGAGRHRPHHGDLARLPRALPARAARFLFGDFTIADAMYAPVVSRFRTYEIELDDEAQAYADAIWALPGADREWLAAARNEPW